MLWLALMIPIAAIAGLAFAAFLAWDVLRKDQGTKEMQEISNYIKEGAEAFLKRQYKTIAVISIVLAFVLFTVMWLGTEASGGVSEIEKGALTAIAFLFGAGCSAIAGYVGMYVSVRANSRVASASQRSFGESLQIAFRGGAVSGLIVISMSLLGVGSLYWIYSWWYPETVVPYLIVGYGFGASLVALFAQLGGGIYTKAADVGADLVGKIEAGIPEDDPRNAAVVADLVGDNVGDCAGRGADLFESTAAENIGAMILGVLLYPVFGIYGILFPLVARSFGLIAAMIGIFLVRAKEDEHPMAALNRGYYITSILAMLFFVLTTYLMLNETVNNQTGNWWIYYAVAGALGVVVSIAYVFITQYYTDSKYRPVKDIAEASKTGPATNIISGFAVGLECTFLPIIVIVGALLGSFELGTMAARELGINYWQGGLYGTAIATMGMLAPAAFILAMDTFGPITDNAGGINEMSGAPKEMRDLTDKLDSAGNTTKALTKGYAVGSAALAAFLLFSAYIDEVRALDPNYWNEVGTGLNAVTVVNLGSVEVFAGAMIAGMLIFLFSSLAIRAVGKAAGAIIEEVRRQFREIPGLMEGKAKPEYGKTVDIATKSALKEMILPGILPVLFPAIVGILLGAEAIAAFLMVGTIIGILMALMFNNSGGAWDNAKKSIEAGELKDKDGKVIGKGSETHAASVVGDTVGDPFKDTAGPSLHVVIKLLSTITLVLAPLFV